MDNTRAFSCEFVAGSRHCSHSDRQLFRSAYQRTNRTQRTKIVRCFPHCCPRHVPRSYCGSPMQLRVTAKSVSDDRDEDGLAMTDLQVFSRFRSVETAALTAGTRLSASTINANVQSERRTTAEWIVSRVLQAPFQGYEGWRFELNPSGRWFYAWDSGATKARRQMRHLLETVVVLPCDSGQSFEVVATACSTSFTFVSFRRAADGEVVESDLSPLYRELSFQLQEQQYLAPSSNRQITAVLSRTRVRPRGDALAVDPLGVDNWNQHSSGDESLSPRKKRLCSAHQQPVRHQVDASAFLGAIIGFVDHLSAAQLPLDLVLRGTLTKSDKAFRLRRYSTKSSFVAGIDAVDAAIRLVWRLRMSRRVALVSAQFSSWAGEALLDLEALQLAFWQWMQVVRQHIERILEEYGWSMDELSRALAAMSPGESATQEHRHEYDWGSFVANVRQQRVFQHQLSGMSTPRQLTVFSGEWSCSLSDVELSLEDTSGFQQPSHHEPLHQLSAGCVFFFWTQLSRLSIDTSQLDSASQLRVTSALHGHVLRQPVRLVLDGTFRLFDTLPCGQSTLSSRLPGSFLTGDYTGYVCPQSGRIHVTTFVWPSGDNVDDPAFRWHWTMQFQHNNQELQLFVRVDVGSLVHSHINVPLETLSVREKLDRIKSWKPFAHAVLPYTASDARHS